VSSGKVRTVQRLLFALPALARPGDALRLAAKLASLYRAELHVLGVIPAWSTAGPPMSGRSMDDGGVVAQLAREAPGRLAEWVYGCRPMDCRPTYVGTEEGDFVLVVERAAKRLGAALVVVPVQYGGLGRRVTRLARAIQVPVLVAGAATIRGPVVAATDVSDPTYPVLTHACTLAERLGNEVVMVHNLDGPCAHSWMPHDVAAADRNRAALRAFCRHASPGATTLVFEITSTADAVLQVARQRNADLIVVGTTARPWLRDLLSRGTATQIIDRADGSVLVVPVQRVSRRRRRHDETSAAPSA
jgi:nucleotide-binding universal stress UspA family protein